MKAILIDPFNRTITDIDIADDVDKTDAINKVINAPVLSAVTPVRGLTIYVDDLGLYREGQAYWAMPHVVAQSHLGGRALALGFDSAGRSINVPVTVEDLRFFIEWRDPPEDEAMTRLRQITVTEL